MRKTPLMTMYNLKNLIRFKFPFFSKKMILFSSNNKTDAEIITLLSVTGTSPENCQVQRLGSNTENKKR